MGAADGCGADGDAAIAAIVAAAAGFGSRPERDQKDEGRGSKAAPLSRPAESTGAYWRAVPPPPGTIWARVGGAAALAKKIVPTVLDAKLRLPEVPKFTGVAVT